MRVFAVAGVLGVVAGVCGGYVVQAGRAPTPLPPLSQPVVAQASGPAPVALSAAQDRRVRVDGDLRKLLLKRPEGAQDLGAENGSDGWLDLAGYAKHYKEPSTAFAWLGREGFRRGAAAWWREDGGSVVEIYLVQFRSGEELGASDVSASNQEWASEQASTRSWHLPGTGEGNGRVFVHDVPEREEGYLPMYSGEAHAWRGDLYMEVQVYDDGPVSKSRVMGLAERQLGEL